MTARWTSPSHRQVIRSVSTGLAIRLIFRLLPSTHLQPFLDRLPPRVLERLRLSVDSRFRRPPLPRARTRLELIADALRHRASIAVSLHLEGRLWNPRPGLPIHTLHLQAAMIDPGREARVAKRLVAHPCPALPRELQLLDQGAQSHAATRGIIQLEHGLRSKALDPRLARGREQVCMEVARVAAGKVAGRVHGQVEGEPVSFGELP